MFYCGSRSWIRISPRAYPDLDADPNLRQVVNNRTDRERFKTKVYVESVKFMVFRMDSNTMRIHADSDLGGLP